MNEATNVNEDKLKPLMDNSGLYSIEERLRPFLSPEALAFTETRQTSTVLRFKGENDGPDRFVLCKYYGLMTKAEKHEDVTDEDVRRFAEFLNKSIAAGIFNYGVLLPVATISAGDKICIKVYTYSDMNDGDIAKAFEEAGIFFPTEKGTRMIDLK